MIDYRFYDTSSLLLKLDSLFGDNEPPFAISSITLSELEEIKTSGTKDADIKYAARRLLHLLDEHRGEYNIHIYKESMLEPIKAKDLPINNDMKILATAFDYDNTVHPDETFFVTNDLALKGIANLFFGDGCIESVNEDTGDNYTGYLDITFKDNEEMEYFYSHYKQESVFDILPNQYIILREPEGSIIDRLVWTTDGYRTISFDSFDSR